TTCRGVSRRAAISSLHRPSAAYSTIRARTTSEYDDVYRRARASSSVRSASAKAMLYGLVRGMLPPSSREPSHVTVWKCGTKLRHCNYAVDHLAWASAPLGVVSDW